MNSTTDICSGCKLSDLEYADDVTERMDIQYGRGMDLKESGLHCSHKIRPAMRLRSN